MSSPIRPYPYAAKAYIQHEFDVDHLNVWLTFRHPMDQTVKPANDLWLCEVDGVPKDITASAWQSEFTMLLTVDDVDAFPDRVLVSYNGPDETLRTTWGKQWEPWSEILSLSVPYGWEGVIFIDIVNQRVGIAGPPLTRTFEIASLDGSDRLIFYHDNFHAWFKVSDGGFKFMTDEGINTDTFVQIFGKGTGLGSFRGYDQTDLQYIHFRCDQGISKLSAAGAVPVAFSLQNDAAVPIRMFYLPTEGETPLIYIGGFRTGDIRRWLTVGVGVNAPDTVSFAGLSDYRFYGNLRAVAGEVESAKAKMTSIGGFAVLLTNKTGVPSVAGDIVIASTVTQDAVALPGGNELMPIGAFLDSGIIDGNEAWIVQSGICDIHMDAGGCALGDRIVTSLTPGRGDVNNLPAVAAHFQEIGHALEIAAANANARIMMHIL